MVRASPILATFTCLWLNWKKTSMGTKTGPTCWCTSEVRVALHSSSKNAGLLFIACFFFLNLVIVQLVAYWKFPCTVMAMPAPGPPFPSSAFECNCPHNMKWPWKLFSFVTSPITIEFFFVFLFSDSLLFVFHLCSITQITFYYVFVTYLYHTCVLVFFCFSLKCIHVLFMCWFHAGKWLSFLSFLIFVLISSDEWFQCQAFLSIAKHFSCDHFSVYS